MKFIKYPSLENHYRKKFLDIIDTLPVSKVEWVATEKLHGANFSLWYLDGDVKAARRSGFLEEGESFYGSQEVVDHYTPKLKGLAEAFGVSSLVVFGELVGESVQKGVNYCEGKDFIIFDLATPNGELLHFYDYTDVLIDEVEKRGFTTATLLHRGSFEEVMQLNNEFNSTIGTKDFTAEGFVAKPTTSVFAPNGSRVIIKSKNEKFSETSRPKKPKVELPTLVVELKPLVEDYITENRFDNVLSKEGEFDIKFFGKYIGLLTNDALEDFIKDNEVDIGKADAKLLKKQLADKARQVIKTKM